MREKRWPALPSVGALTGDAAYIQPFDVQDNAPTEPPGRAALVFINHVFLLTLGLIALVFLLS